MVNINHLSLIGVALFFVLFAYVTGISFPTLSTEVISSRNLDFLLYQNYTLPRIAVSIVAGAVLGLTTILLQQVIRNPLASDSTLAVSSGAQMALFIATIFVPSWLTYGSVPIAITGALLALGLVFAISANKISNPLAMILSGLVVSLYLGSIVATLLILFPEETRGLSLWGAGSLIQDSWLTTLVLLLASIPAVLIIIALARSFKMLTLDDVNAKKLGVPVGFLRIVSVLITAYLVAVVVSYLGMISFVGLISASIVRNCRVYDFYKQLVYTPLVGAILLSVTDLTVQIVNYHFDSQIPTGAVTAFIGSPLFLWLMFKHFAHSQSVKDNINATIELLEEKNWKLWTLFGTLLILIIGSFIFGHGVTGWEISFKQDLLALRFPRIMVALACGVMLAIAGLILQQISHNPTASPELLGISSGVNFGIVFSIFVVGSTALWSLWLFGFFGALIILVLVLLINYRNQFAPEKVLLTGISITALYDALQRILIASNDFRAFTVVNFTNGSTYFAVNSTSVIMLGLSLVGIALVFILVKWLDLLSLGDVIAKSLGLHLTHAALWLTIIASALTTIATLNFGAYSFVGLTAPHLARALGFYHIRKQILASILIGAIIMVLADWVGRQIMFPYEIPLGTVATLIGGTYFLFVVRKL